MLSNSENQRGRPFRPGQSGNPKGRPRGAEDLRKRILKALHAKRDGKRAVDLLIDSLLTRALVGNLPAAKVLVEYAYGKPVSIADVIERDTQAGTVIIGVPEEAFPGLPVFSAGGDTEANRLTQERWERTLRRWDNEARAKAAKQGRLDEHDAERAERKRKDDEQRARLEAEFPQK